MRAIGYHGTSVGAARRILSGGFRSSRNAYDWLGDGIYFFQDAPLRAADWARTRFGADAAVVGAEIDLDGCIDLLDVRWHAVLRATYAALEAWHRARGKAMPRQTRGAHRLDRALINHVVSLIEARGGTVRSARAAFREGEPLFPGSALYDLAHVQIAVREPTAILRHWRAE